VLIAGALAEEQYRRTLETAAWVDMEAQPSHAVHEHAFAATIRAIRG
jgi:arsenite methyltransferase